MGTSPKTVYIKTNKNVQRAIFDTIANVQIIAAAGAGKKNYIVAISMHNNNGTGTNDTRVKITDGNGGADLYGGVNGQIYLVGRGGFFGLPMSIPAPWLISSANTAIFLNPVAAKRVSGAVWYYQE